VVQRAGAPAGLDDFFFWLHFTRIHHLVQRVGAPHVLAALLLFLRAYAMEILVWTDGYVFFLFAFVRACAHIHLHIYVHIHACSAHAHARTRARAHTHTHTNTQVSFSVYLFYLHYSSGSWPTSFPPSTTTERQREAAGVREGGDM